MAAATDTYANQLRAALDRLDLSIRKAGRLYNPADPESGRRAMHDWLSGKTDPTAETRQRIADALGVTREDIEGTEGETS